MKKILDYIDNHIFLQCIIATITVVTILAIIINKRTAELYEVQAEIVIHDYGHIYENINDWKLDKIEKLEKEIKNETEIKTH